MKVARPAYSGVLYAILALEVRRVKIGKTDSDSALVRLASFRTGSPCELSLHSQTATWDIDAAEREAHERLAHARVLGEWFDCTDPEVDRWLAEREREISWDQPALRQLIEIGLSALQIARMMGADPDHIAQAMRDHERAHATL